MDLSMTTVRRPGSPFSRLGPLTFLAVSMALAACGGGGGGSGGASSTPDRAPDPAAPRPGSTVSGISSKGPLSGATVCIHAADRDADNGLGGKIAALEAPNVSSGCYVTGADGSYKLTLPAGAPRDVVLVSSGGHYCSDEGQVEGAGCANHATLLGVPADTPLSAALILPEGDGSASVHITPLTQAAWQNALGRKSRFADEFAALGTALELPPSLTAAIAPDEQTREGKALKAMLRQIALSIATGGSAALGDAIATLAQGKVPPIGQPGKACEGEASLDGRLGCLLQISGVASLEAPPVVSDAMFNVGRDLFTSNQLSGSGTVSCSSCHGTNNAGVETAATLNGVSTVRALHLSLRGGAATAGNNTSIHRNAPDLVNKLLGAPQFMFWDGRVAVDKDGGFTTPAGSLLPAGLDNVLAAQALFPLLSREEMLGFAPGSNGGLSENASAGLAADPVEANPVPVWNAIMDRVKADATLSGGLATAYPGVPTASLGIQHVANALAAYQTRRWNPTRPTANFHGYLAGTVNMVDAAKRGGILFFDKARCFQCHSGPKLTDSKFHNLAVPQIGPGFGSGAASAPLADKGRYEVTKRSADLYAFLTPSLWEVRSTAPYFHNGVYGTLEKTVRHHLDAAAGALAFRCADAPALQTGVNVACRDSQDAPALYTDMVSRLAPELKTLPSLSDSEIADLLTFLDQFADGQN
jgi:cytochrome c peroxidase